MRSAKANLDREEMDSKAGENVNGPPLKRPKLDTEDKDVPSSSKLANESYDSGDAGCGSGASSLENVQDEEVDHESDDSMDDGDISDLDLAGLNDQCDETSWQPVAGPISWVQRQMILGTDPREILRRHIGIDQEIPPEWDQMKLWQIIISIMMEPTPRKKLPHINTLDDVVALLQKCQNILVLTGAGVSVSCGIPDFRSRNGIYARLAKDFPNLPNPQSMFDIDFFRSDQRPFFKFAKEIYPGQFEPSLCHKFIKLLEAKGKLLRNYTQNIDTLEKVAGVERIIECHGSFATATCMVCKYNVDAEAIRKDIFDQCIPHCPRCGPDVKEAVMKPDIVFFGESLGEKFHKQMASDKDVCDLLIVIGSSLKVRPVALIPNSVPDHVPQIIINREPLHKRLTFDVELLGNCDDIVSELCKRLGTGWDHLAKPGPLSEEVNYDDLPYASSVPSENPQDLIMKERDVEHSVDSGLGDFEAVTQADSRSNSVGNIDRHSVTNSDRLERLGSSDSGAESSGTVDMPAHTETVKLHAAAASELCPSGSYSQKLENQDSIQDIDKACLEVSTQGDCSGEKRQGSSETSLHTCQPDEPSQSLEACDHSSSACHRTTSEVQHHAEQHSTSKGSTCHKHHSSHSHCQGSENSEKIDLDRESKKDNAHCFHTDSAEELHQTWIPKKHPSIACRCKENQVIHMPPNRYIFPGAEVYSDDSDDSDGSEDTTPPLSPRQEEDHAGVDETNQERNSTVSPPLSLSHYEESQSSASNTVGAEAKEQSHTSSLTSSPCLQTDVQSSSDDVNGEARQESLAKTAGN